MSDNPEIGGYEWSFTCVCGQSVGLSGMGSHPVNLDEEKVDEFYNHDLTSSRIRNIEGMKVADCPNPDCDRTLRIGIEVVEDRPNLEGQKVTKGE